MAKRPAVGNPDDGDQALCEARNALIGQRVMNVLGEPGDLLRVHVRHLWDRCYRVNVYVGPDAASARVANSYFLEVDGDGNIVASTPSVLRQYGPSDEGPSPLPAPGLVACG